jgi:DNA adenine methylase
MSLNNARPFRTAELSDGFAEKPVLAEPFLKWAGGKRQLLDQILPHIPSPPNGARYFEPFLGGGAVFFALQHKHSFLSDSNPELIETFQAVRDNVESVIDALCLLPYSKNSYYEVRDSKPSGAVERAARFIYLNKTCFNGLYRVNLKGEFNVPFGQHGPNVEICNRSQLRNASRALKAANIETADFESAVQKARPGDVVYFDPPYYVAHNSNGFIEYNAKVFSWEDQRRLARVALILVNSGISVIVSNADHPLIIESYVGSSAFNAVRVHRWTTIAGKATKRLKTTELELPRFGGQADAR